jgi:O-antigen ligase
MNRGATAVDLVVIFRSARNFLLSIGSILIAFGGRWNASRILPESGFAFLLSARLLGLLCLLLALALTQRYAIPRSWPTAAFFVSLLLFVVYATVSLTWSTDGAYGLQKVLELWIILFASFALYQLTRHAACLKSILLATVAFVVLFLTLSTVLSLESATPGRAAILGGGPNVFGRIMGLSCIVGLGLILYGRRLPGVIILPSALFFLVLSGSRGAQLSLVLTALVSIILLPEFRSAIRRYLPTLVVASGSAVLVIALTPALADFVYHRFIYMTFIEHHSAGRWGIFLDALYQWNAQPILGDGVGAFNSISDFKYPHNIFLEVVAELGILGLVLFLAQVVAIIGAIAGWRPRGSSEILIVPLVMALGFSFLAAQVSGDFYDDRLIWMISAVLFGIIYGHYERKDLHVSQVGGRALASDRCG